MARAFSTPTKLSKEQQKEAIYQEEYIQKQQEGSPAAKNKFFEFIQAIDEVDSQVDSSAQSQAQKNEFDVNDLDVSFDSIDKTIDLRAFNSTGKTEDLDQGNLDQNAA